MKLALYRAKKLEMRKAQVGLPGDPLAVLIAGNQRFVEGLQRKDVSEERRTRVAEEGQAPYAAVVDCSDSRVAPELIFDAGLGELFVVRTAGNVVSEIEIGSLEYAVDHLGVELILVLGHTDCGAVKAAMGTEQMTDDLTTIIARIQPAVEQARELSEGTDAILELAVDINAQIVRDAILADKDILSKVQGGQLRVVSGVYNVKSGAVTIHPDARQVLAVLGKAREFPVGTIREWGGTKFRKTGPAQWVPVRSGERRAHHADGSDGGRARAKKDAKAASALDRMQAVAAGTAKSLREQTTTRDRIVDGQAVSYWGHKHGQHRGQKGVLLGMGDGGAVLVKVGKDIIDSSWANCKPEGTIKEHSPFDGLTDKNLYQAGTEVMAKVNDVMDKPIGTSGITYRGLVEVFRNAGFTMYIVGGTVRDFLSGKEANDIDFVVNATDNEIRRIIQTTYPKWTMGWVLNDHLGLTSFTDGNDTVDITPIHLFSEGATRSGMLKGWRLKGDAEARDFTINSLQMDPTTGVIVDGTGTGSQDIDGNTLKFCNPAVLKFNPRYTLRALKFLFRGVKPLPETEQAIRDNLKYAQYLSPKSKKRFMEAQILAKDGVPGLRGFKRLFMQYDPNGALWNNHFETIYKAVMREAGAA